ncbi:MAG: cysteine desulfurase [Cytophagaceae bacterium]|jgi:cysteine desulfurase/selenocysteine lyase|nr:cysteine desulfurase [Cytophagaceae bacterium]
MIFPINNIRNDFPILHRKVNGKPLVYFDNGATTQKPVAVIKAMEEAVFEYNSNIHRGVHTLSNVCTEAFEKAREKVARFIGAAHTHEVIFTRGTTESINLVTSSFGEMFLNANDEIILTEMEHHSNIVPWQLLQKRKGVRLNIVPIRDDGTLDMETFDAFLCENTKLVTIAHISNVLGTVNPVNEIVEKAHQRGIPVLIDGAQAIQHLSVNVTDLDCDFYAFSGHKMYAPTGIGILYGKEKWLNRMEPYHGGGEMIKHVSFKGTTFNELPYKFEAGTPNYTAAIGLGAAIDYIESVGLVNIREYENMLFDYAISRMSEIENVTFYGTSAHRTSLISFLLNGIHPFDTGTLLDKMGIAVRTGHHCAQPLMKRLNIQGTVRASFAMYNTCEEVDALINGLVKVRQLFG